MIILLFLLFVGAYADCTDVDCGANAFCKKADNNEYTCKCKESDGYYGNDVPNGKANCISICADKDCGPNAFCVDHTTDKTIDVYDFGCECVAGYHAEDGENCVHGNSGSQKALGSALGVSCALAALNYMS